MEKVLRPQADKKKINCKEEFELCYLRHQYLRKSEYNPSQKDMLPYNIIISQQARNTYFTYQKLFGAIGLECEDLLSIARVQLVSYLSLFSIEKMPHKQEEFNRVFENLNLKTPKESDILNKNKANFTIFLKQRMEDLVRVCRQKSRNVTGFRGDEQYIYVGTRKPPRILANLKTNYEKYGYKKLDIAVFKTIRRRADATGLDSFQFNGKWYVSLKFGNKILTLDDFSGADLDPYDSLHNMSPERICSERQEEHYWGKKREEFESYKPNKRAKLLKSFVSSHSNDPAFKAELRLAKKLLKEIGA